MHISKSDIFTSEKYQKCYFTIMKIEDIWIFDRILFHRMNTKCSVFKSGGNYD